MAYSDLFANYKLPTTSDSMVDNTSTYVHPFILKQLLEYSKEMKTMGLWKVAVNESIIVLEIKGYDEPIYMQLLNHRNEDIVLFFEGAEKYAVFTQQQRKNKLNFQQLPIVGMLRFTDKTVLEKYDRDLLTYLNINCKGSGAYPMIRTSSDEGLVFPDNKACLLMARACECAYRMFSYLYSDNLKKMYMSGLLMYQTYNEKENVYEYKMAKLTQSSKQY